MATIQTSAALSPAERAYLLAHVRAERAGRAEQSLYSFIKQAWPVVEGSRPFVHGDHITMICEHLEAVVAGEIRRLIINIPPRHMKSSALNVFWPAWIWAQEPDSDRPLAGAQTSILSASNAYGLTLRDAVACRRLIESEWYRERWGDRFAMLADQNAKHRYRNDRAGERLSVSVGSKLTGEGADLLLLDDPHDTIETESQVQREAGIDWWRYSMSTRMNDPRTSAVVLIMQRLHERDLTGYLLEQGGWEHLCLPSRAESDHPHRSTCDPRADGDLLWPHRFTEEDIAAQEATLGTYGFSGQHQQRPAPREGGMFDPQKWGIVDQVPKGGVMVRAWDLAATEEASGKTTRAAYTVGLLMKLADRGYYIEDVLRFRGGPREVREAMRNTAAQDGYNVIIDFPQDPGQAGKAQAQDLAQMLAGHKVHYSPETGAKETRAEPLAAQQEAGNVYLKKAPWNRQFIDEAALFPNSEYLDQIDAASRAFARLTRRRSTPSVGRYSMR